jgi:hypothetical protein
MTVAMNLSQTDDRTMLGLSDLSEAARLGLGLCTGGNRTRRRRAVKDTDFAIRRCKYSYMSHLSITPTLYNNIIHPSAILIGSRLRKLGGPGLFLMIHKNGHPRRHKIPGSMTHRIFAVDRLSEDQSLLQPELLRHPLPRTTTVPIVDQSANHNQEASNKAAHDTASYCPRSALGRRLKRTIRRIESIWRDLKTYSGIGRYSSGFAAGGIGIKL